MDDTKVVNMLQSHAELRDPILHFAHGKLQIVPYHRTPAAREHPASQRAGNQNDPECLVCNYVCLAHFHWGLRVETFPREHFACQKGDLHCSRTVGDRCRFKLAEYGWLSWWYFLVLIYIYYMYSNVFTSVNRSKYCPSRSFECHSLCIFLQVSPFHAAVSLATGVYLTLYISAGIKLEDNPIAEHILLNKGVRVSKCKCCRAFNAPLLWECRHSKQEKRHSRQYWSHLTVEFDNPFIRAFDAQRKSTSCATHSWRTFCNNAISSKPRRLWLWGETVRRQGPLTLQFNCLSWINHW